MMRDPTAALPCLDMPDEALMDHDDLSRISFEVDMRLTDVWTMVFERAEDGIDDDFLAWLLRLAYVTGYWDSLSEPERGALCHALGYPVPGRDETGATGAAQAHESWGQTRRPFS